MKTLIIDSNYIGHQAQHALPDLSHNDVATGVVFGFLCRILSLGLFFKTNDIIFCWDSRHSKRRDKYPWYKQRRRKGKTPEQIKLDHIAYKQFRDLRRNILPTIGFKNQLIQKGYESDDIMASIVCGKIGGWIIVTADQDLFQCLYRNVRVYNPSKKKMMTRKRFTEEYGIEPSRWREVKTIAGCTSDSIPGVKGVGNSTAIKYLNHTLPQTSKKYKSITNHDSELLIQDLWLVSLPLPGTKEPKMMRDRFSLNGLVKVFKKYGLDSFLEDDRVAEWKQLFQMRD